MWGKVRPYLIEIRSRAYKDLKTVPRSDVVRILKKIRELENGLHGDIKRLTNFTPEYRLRVGRYRILFEIEGDKLIVFRIKHRKEVYQ